MELVAVHRWKIGVIGHAGEVVLHSTAVGRFQIGTRTRTGIAPLAFWGTVTVHVMDEGSVRVGVAYPGFSAACAAENFRYSAFILVPHAHLSRPVVGHFDAGIGRAKLKVKISYENKTYCCIVDLLSSAYCLFSFRSTVLPFLPLMSLFRIIYIFIAISYLLHFIEKMTCGC